MAHGGSLVLTYPALLAFGYRAALACMLALAIARAFDIEREKLKSPPAPPVEEVLPLLFEGDGEAAPRNVPRH